MRKVGLFLSFPISKSLTSTLTTHIHALIPSTLSSSIILQAAILHTRPLLSYLVS